MSASFDLSTERGRNDLAQMIADKLSAIETDMGRELILDCVERGITFEQWYPLVIKRYSAIPALRDFSEQLAGWGISLEDVLRRTFERSMKRVAS